jgi:hypothetical protein
MQLPPAGKWRFVVSSLPRYLLGHASLSSNLGLSSLGSLFASECEGNDSASEWLGEEFDFVVIDSSIDGQRIDDDVNENFESELHLFEEWASTSNAFRVVPLSNKKFREYYADRNWSFDHVKLKGPRQFFKGPKPGGKYESNKGLVYKAGNFWLLY